MEYFKNYYEKHKEYIKQKNKEYRLITDYDRSYYLRNKDRIKNRMKNKYLENKDHTDVKYNLKDKKIKNISLPECNYCNRVFFSKQTLKYHQDNNVCFKNRPFTIIHLD
jgi:hypothetical protein